MVVRFKKFMMKSMLESFFKVSAVSFLCVLVWVGCEETTIDPFSESQGAFSIYGALNADSLTNYVRIKYAHTPLQADEETLEPFSVTFEDIANGITTTLSDTVIDQGGNPTQNFIVNGALEERTQYRITATSSKGETSTSLLTTPGIAQHEFSPETTSTCYDQITFTFNNVKDPEFVRFEAGVSYQGAIYYAWIESVDQLEHVPGEDKMTVELSVRNLLVDIFPPIAEQTVNRPPRYWVPTVTCNELDDGIIRIRYIHFGPEWESLQDAELALDFFDAGAVENGFGMFGSIRRGEFSFVTDGV